METHEKLVAPLFEKIQEYGKTSYELIRLKTIEKLVKVISETISRLIVIFVVIMFIVFLSLALAIWLGQILGEMYLGFACVAAFYAVFGGSLFLFCRKWLKTKIANALINHILN